MIKKFANTEDKKRLLSNFFSLSVLQVLSYILPLLTLPYLVRVLGTEKFGLVMFAQAFIIFFHIFVDFGFNLSATREISLNRNDKEKITEIFSSVMLIKAALITISFIILSVIVFSFRKFSNDWELYYLSFLWVAGQALFPFWFFQGIERMKYVTIVNIVSKLTFTLLIFIVIQDQSDYIYVPLVNGIGFLLGGVISLYIVYKTFNQKFKIYSFKTVKKYFLDSAQFFLSRVSVSIYTSSNAFVLGLHTNNIMVGHYVIAEKLYGALQSFYEPISQVLYPYIAKEKNIVLFKKIFTLFIVINTLGIVFLFFEGEHIFDLLFTTAIGSESLTVFHIFLIAALVIVPTILLGYPFLGALGYAKYANLSVIIGSVFHLFGLTLLWLTDNLNIYSVSSMVVVTQIIILLYVLYGVKKHCLWNTSYKVNI